ncbi:MAG: glycoside hydrolase family 10 [Clostridiales bacterium]|jgi:endo-1,4-beta-xylanase|nr:glycoside hydrolase family 10 [Clostridiales bacterium]
MSRRETALKYFLNKNDALLLRERSGIELYRKGNAEIVLSTADGKSLPEEITVEAVQTGHEFKFGANIFMLDEFESEDKNCIYRKKFPELFNLATLPFYWCDIEPEQGKLRFDADSPRRYRRPAIDLCMDYCFAHGIEPKCHCLNYDSEIPSWVVDKSVEEHKRLLAKRFSEIADRYAHVIPDFEVTNETLRESNSKFFYEDDFLPWSFRTAERYFPNNRLIINDYNIWFPETYNNRLAYYMQIERLLKEGCRIDSIGLQLHSFFPQSDEAKMAESRYNPENLYRLLDAYGKFGLPEQITEMTVPAYSDTAEDEEIQAELLRGIYTTCFSHKAMEAIIYWNLVDGYAHETEPGDFSKGENLYYGGLLRFDMSEKPAYRALYDLINKEWKTETAVPVRNGRACFRGFYGDYMLKIHTGEKVVEAGIKLSKQANSRFPVVI